MSVPRVNPNDPFVGRFLAKSPKWSKRIEKCMPGWVGEFRDVR